MITINKIEKKFDFPVIDFKFQNTGDATAILWEFSVAIKKIELDLTPTLEFRYDVNGGSLEIFAKNNGYGKACNCEVKIAERTLEKMFPHSSLSFNGSISSDEEVKILTISKDSYLKQEISSSLEIKQYLNKLPLHHVTPKEEGISIEEIKVFWKCNSESEKPANGNDYVSAPTHGRLILTNDGFYFHMHHVSYCLMQPSQIYCVIIDVDKGNHIRVYSISRQIASGDVDRFHIMIGATKSSIINIEFSFKIDSGTIVKSEEFKMEIWNSLHSNFHNEYIDGEMLEAEVKELSEKGNDFWYKDKKKDLEELKKDKEYPFLTDKNLKRRFDY